MRFIINLVNRLKQDWCCLNRLHRWWYYMDSDPDLFEYYRYCTHCGKNEHSLSYKGKHWWREEEVTAMPIPPGCLYVTDGERL